MPLRSDIIKGCLRVALLSSMFRIIAHDVDCDWGLHDCVNKKQKQITTTIATTMSTDLNQNSYGLDPKWLRTWPKMVMDLNQNGYGYCYMMRLATTIGCVFKFSMYMFLVFCLSGCFLPFLGWDESIGMRFCTVSILVQKASMHLPYILFMCIFLFLIIGMGESLRIGQTSARFYHALGHRSENSIF